MKNILRHFIAISLVSYSSVAFAAPIELKLSFFGSDRTHLYRSSVKPFVDAVNAAGRGRVEIKAYPNSQLGPADKQSQLLVDGTADIAYVVLPYERAVFPDSMVIELPGLYRDGREATAAFTHLVEAGMMRGFEKFFAIGTVASEPESIHSLPPIRTIADIKGKRIRANNHVEIDIIKMLGGSPVFVPLNKTAGAISRGEIDAAMAPPVPMVEFGIGRVAPNHYFLPTACVPQSLLMRRARFEKLPEDVQAIIRRFSGEWLTQTYNQINETSTSLVMTQLESEPKRTVTFPSRADMRVADRIFRTIVERYAAETPHNAAMVKAARATVSKLRGPARASSPSR